MLLTSNDKLARKAVQLRHQGRDPSLGWNSHADVGFSYHLADINCALGTSQLARIENTIAKRQRIAESYDRELARIPETVRPPLASDVGRISWFVYPVQLTQEFTAGDRDRICEAMLHKGIATGRYFAPLHRQPVIRTTAKPFTTEDTEVHRGRHTEKNHEIRLPSTEFVADRVIALPFFNEMTFAEIQEVCASLADSIHELWRRT
jgi:dTDP-4-amino-4,6-dideoxygalactose transaminase